MIFLRQLGVPCSYELGKNHVSELLLVASTGIPVFSYSTAVFLFTEVLVFARISSDEMLCFCAWLSGDAYIQGDSSRIVEDGLKRCFFGGQKFWNICMVFHSIHVHEFIGDLLMYVDFILLFYIKGRMTEKKREQRMREIERFSICLFILQRPTTFPKAKTRSQIFNMIDPSAWAVIAASRSVCINHEDGEWKQKSDSTLGMPTWDVGTPSGSLTCFASIPTPSHNF